MTDTTALLRRADDAIARSVEASTLKNTVMHLTDAVRDLVEVVRRQQVEINALKSARQTSMGRPCK